MLERFDTIACNSAHSPMKVRLVLDKLKGGKTGPDLQLFQSLFWGVEDMLAYINI